MSQNLLFEELYRIREMMGVKTNSNTLLSEVKNLLLEGVDPTDVPKAAKKLIGLEDEMITVFAKAGLEDALVKVSDDMMAAVGKKTFAELMTDVVGKGYADSVDEITQESIEQYIKGTPELLKVVDDLAIKVVQDVYSTEIKAITNLQNIFDDAAEALKGELSDAEYNLVKNLPADIETKIATPVTTFNKGPLKTTLEAQDELLSKLPQSDEVVNMRLNIKLKQNQIAQVEIRVQEELNQAAAKQEADAIEDLASKGISDLADEGLESGMDFKKIADDAVEEACTKNPKLCKGLDLDTLKGDLEAFLKNLTENANRAQKVWDKYGPTQKLEILNRLIKKIEKNSTNLDKKGGEGFSTWLINFFKKRGKNAKDADKIPWGKIYKVMFVGYLLVCNGLNPDYEKLETNALSQIKPIFKGFLACAGKALFWPGSLIYDTITGISQAINAVDNTRDGFIEWFKEEQEDGKYSGFNSKNSAQDQNTGEWYVVNSDDDVILFKYIEDKETFEEVK